MTKVQILKDAFQHSLSQIRVALPQNIVIQKIEAAESVKLMLFKLLEQLPDELKNYICASSAHCKSCGYHGPVPVISKQRHICQCGGELDVLVQPLFQAFYYESACNISVTNLAALITIDCANQYHSILVNQALNHYILCNASDEKLFIKPDYALAYFRSQLDSEFYPKLGRPLLAIYTNNGSKREVEFTAVYQAQNALPVMYPKSGNQESYFVADQPQHQPIYLENPASAHQPLVIKGTGAFYKVQSRESTVVGVCDCCGLRCFVSRTWNACACAMFCFVFCIFIVNLVLFAVCIAAKQQDPSVFVTDAVIVRGHGLFGYDTDESSYSVTVASLEDYYGAHAAYSYNLQADLLKVATLNTTKTVAAAGVAAEDLVLSELVTYNLTVYEDARFYGYYLRFYGANATFSEGTQVVFATDADFTGDIKLQRAYIDDLTVDNLNLTGLFVQNGQMDDFQVDQLAASAGSINEVQTVDMTISDATFERLNITGSASIKTLSATNSNVTSDLTIRNSQVRIPSFITLNQPATVVGNVYLANKTKLYLKANAKVANVTTITAELAGGTIETAAVDALNLTSAKLSGLNATTLDFKQNVKYNDKQILQSNNGVVSAHFSSVRCNGTFTADQNVTATYLRTRSVNITNTT